MILKRLPCLINYMVYFIKRHLVVYFKDDDKSLDYVALSQIKGGPAAFNKEMELLRKQLALKDLEAEVEAKEKRDQEENKRAMLEHLE